MPERLGCTELAKLFMDGYIIVRAQGNKEFLIDLPRQPELQFIANATDMALALVFLATDRFTKDMQHVHETEPLTEDHAMVAVDDNRGSKGMN